MQRLFSMFPPGAPGIGLLVLRISVAATFVLITANRTGMSSIHPLFAGALAVAFCLAIGFLTPYLSFIVCVYALINVFGASGYLDILLFASLLLSSAALGLLGPGAYSIDARLFGRRVVVVPPRRDTDLKRESELHPSPHSNPRNKTRSLRADARRGMVD